MGRYDGSQGRVEATTLDRAGGALSETKSVCAGQFKQPFVVGGRSYLESRPNSFWLLPTHTGFLPGFVDGSGIPSSCSQVWDTELEGGSEEANSCSGCLHQGQSRRRC